MSGVFSAFTVTIPGWVVVAVVVVAALWTAIELARQAPPVPLVLDSYLPIVAEERSEDE